MNTTCPEFLKKIKKRRIFIVSAGGIEGGVQCLYFSIYNDTWEIIAHASMPYPKKIASLFNAIISRKSTKTIFDQLIHLDFKISQFITETAKNTLSRLPASVRKPHFILFVKTELWKSTISEEGSQQQLWDLTLGDAQFIASTLRTPVFTDFIRHHCLAGGQGTLPTDKGNINIGTSFGGTVVLVNIGLISRITIIDAQAASILIDSDTGPGTCCINTLIRRDLKSISPDGFDRDGSLAGKGTVSGNCLQELSSTPWFCRPAPKFATTNQFNDLLTTESFTKLSTYDQLATITALTARTIYDFFRREYKNGDSNVSVYLSGGGSNNFTLQHFLQTYFDSIPVRPIEHMGIPADMRIPLAFGITVNKWLKGEPVAWEQGKDPCVQTIGTWVMP